MKSKSISIIIPALNEELTIGKVIDEIPKEDLQKMGYRVEIIVVDNNSIDSTHQIAKGNGVEVIMETQKGKGRAVATAFKFAKGDFIFMIDADHTYPATYIPEMLEVLQKGYDVVIGSRLKGQIAEGAMSKTNLVGNHLLAFMASVLFRTRISDLCTGYWGLTRRVVDNIRLEAKGFELEANIFTEIARKGYSITEVPICYRRRKTPSNISSLKDGIIIGWTLLKKRFQ